jgi:hypothetical protein
MQCENEKLNNNKARKENCPCHFSNISSVFSQAFSYFIQRSLQFEITFRNTKITKKLVLKNTS